MICSKCSNEGIYNEAMGKGFFYCRTCKTEIEPTESVGDDGQEEFMFGEPAYNPYPTSYPPPVTSSSSTCDGCGYIIVYQGGTALTTHDSKCPYLVKPLGSGTYYGIIRDHKFKQLSFPLFTHEDDEAEEE